MVPEQIFGRFLYSQSEVNQEKERVRNQERDRIRKQVTEWRDEAKKKGLEADKLSVRIRDSHYVKAYAQCAAESAYNRVLALLKDGESDGK